MQIDSGVVGAVRDRLGTLYDEYVQALLDLGTPPIFAFQDDRDRVVETRTRAAIELCAWQQEAPHVLAELVERLPGSLQMNDEVRSLLEAVPHADYFATPDSVFEPPANDSRVIAAAPTLRERWDADGLLDLAGLVVTPHGVLVDGLSVHYHQFLRRGFGSNIHYELIGAILAIALRDDVNFRLAIDDRRLRYEHEHQEIFEKDYWYGPPLEESTVDDPYALGETIHGDPQLGESILNPYVALSARWTGADGLKTVEIEELVPVRDSGRPMARYLHAIRDTKRRCFIHCDGAVKAYDPDVYPRTVEEFPGRGRSALYRKVFRLDGEIHTDEWSDLTARWFRGNALILEYLHGLQAPDQESGPG